MVTFGGRCVGAFPHQVTRKLLRGGLSPRLCVGVLMALSSHHVVSWRSNLLNTLNHDAR